MSALLLIWTTSLVLAAAALLVMAMLIVLRVIASWRRDRHLAARRRLASALLGDGEIDPETLRQIPDHVVTDLSLDLIQLVRGAERERFIRHATELGVPARLARRMRSGPARSRIVALRGLAQFDSEDARAALTRALRDRDRDIRLAAAQSLTDKGETLDLPELIRRLDLGTGQSSRLTVTLFQSLASTRPDEIRALVQQLDENPEVRVTAVEALAATGDFSLVPLIADLALAAEDGSEELARYLHALGKFGHPGGAAAVRAYLASEAMTTRAAAAQAAGRIGMVDAADQLAALLDDPEWWVRFRAAEALVAIGAPGVARLRAAAADDAVLAAEAAEAILAENGIAR